MEHSDTPRFSSTHEGRLYVSLGLPSTSLALLCNPVGIQKWVTFARVGWMEYYASQNATLVRWIGRFSLNCELKFVQLFVF